jgi:hypothetical protein
VFSPGNKEVGYQIGLKALPNEPIYFSNYQRLEMAKKTYPAKQRESRDADATCNP